MSFGRIVGRPTSVVGSDGFSSLQVNTEWYLNGDTLSAVAFVIKLIESVGCGGSVVGSVPCIRNVAGSNPTLAAT